MVGRGAALQTGLLSAGLNRSGWQEKLLTLTMFFQTMPMELVRDDVWPTHHHQGQNSGSALCGFKCGEYRWGGSSCILMDTDRSDNDPVDRWLTGNLYGGNQDTRIAQEVLLGIGGVRMLHALENEGPPQSPPPFFPTYHLNEGHAAFALLE